MRKIICFGDSITEMGVMQEMRGFIARLAERYVRRADILARGFSGYTTREALAILDQAVLDEKPDMVIVFLGDNDGVTPDQIQHVPLDEFKKNYRRMVQGILDGGSKCILVTPPPVDERKTSSRTMSGLAAYAQEIFEVGAESDLPVVDLYHLIQQENEWETKSLMDGLHLNAHGMHLLYEALVKELEKIWPIKQWEAMNVGGF
jgi:isoamyl acetate esterase